MKPLFHFADLWKNFVKLFKNTEVINGDDGDVIVHGDSTAFVGDVYTGEDTSVYDFEHIVDKDGHNRFIEGNGTPTTFEGVTYNYTKWSLSGTHLMLVCDIKIAGETALATNDITVDFAIPKWVFDKLFPSIDPYLDAKKSDIRVSGYVVSGLSIESYCYKVSESTIRICSLAHTAGASDEYARIEFDFLIDNE